MMDAVLDAPAQCYRCGEAGLEDEALAAHITACPGPGPMPSELPEEGLPTRRQPNDVRARPAGPRPLWRRAVRSLRVLVNPAFRRCETCPSFHASAPVLLADHVTQLWIVERADGSATVIPEREVKQWTEGPVHGPLYQAGWCSQHDRGVMPNGTCERWRA